MTFEREKNALLYSYLWAWTGCQNKYPNECQLSRRKNSADKIRSRKDKSIPRANEG